MEHIARNLQPQQLEQLRFDKDVTAVLRKASTELPTNEWLSVKEFTVEHAMNAIELMDPKLDSGANRQRLAPIADRLREGSLPLAGLDSGRVIAIMDKLLHLEVRRSCLYVADSLSVTSGHNYMSISRRVTLEYLSVHHVYVTRSHCRCPGSRAT